MNPKKTNAGESFQRKVFSSLLYSLLLTLTVVFFVAKNLLAVADYEVQSGSHAELFRPIADFRLLTLLALLGGGILFFCLTFWILQRKSFAYIGALSAAMRNMAEGELRAAVEIGRRLARLAVHNQVIVVTHWPQVAAYADAHWHVSKDVGDLSVSSGVVELTGDARVAELSRMLAGLEDTETGRAHAQELLDKAQAEVADFR